MTMSIIESNVLGDGTFARASTGTYYDAAGVLQTAAINVPRLNYNPASLTTAPQLLVEAASTNLLRQSEAPTITPWILSAVTAGAASGGFTPLIETAASALHFHYQAVTIVAGSPYTYARRYKSTGGRRYLRHSLVSGSSTHGFYVDFDLFTGLIVNASFLGSGTYLGSSVVAHPDGSFTVSVSGTNTVTAAFAFSTLRNASTNVTTESAQAYLGDGVSGLAVGAGQIESGSVATSYIPTTTAAVTRAADVVSTTGLIYSSAAENDFPLWVTNTPQIVGDKVIRPNTHRIYQRIIAGTTATAPELDTTNWLDIAPTNRWAMFDDKVGTKTTATGSLTVVMRPGGVDGLGMLELVGQTATVVMKDAPGGVVIYNKVIQLDGTLVTSFYDWFYKPYQQLTDVVFTDLLSSYVSNELTITITGSSTVSIGVCKFGPITNIGALQYGAKIGISSLSIKSFDAFGNALITKRGFRKIADFSIVTQAADFNGIFRKLSSLDAVACIYVGSELTGYEPFLVYGFFKDFNMSVDYISHHLCTASIEGLI